MDYEACIWFGVFVVAMIAVNVAGIWVCEKTWNGRDSRELGRCEKD